MEIFAGLLERFEDFIVRTLLPISVFLFVLVIPSFFIEGYDPLNQLLENIDNLGIHSSEGMKGAIVFLVFLGFAFFMNVFQSLPDYCNKRNYNFPSWLTCFLGIFVCLESKDSFEHLRNKVIEKLKNRYRYNNYIYNIVSRNDINDYALYLILSKISKKAVRKKYVDEVRVIYMCFLSIWMVAGITIVQTYNLSGLYKFLLVVAVGALCFCFACCMGRVRYKNRNRRLYIDYLLNQ